MRRKAQISGFTDLQWGGLIIIFLLIFFILAWATGGNTANQTIKPMNWEASWLATSYAQQPLNDTTLLQALTDPANDKIVEQSAQQLLATTRTGKNQSIWVFAVRNQTRTLCLRLDLPEDEAKACPKPTIGPGTVDVFEETVNARVSRNYANPYELEESLPQEANFAYVQGVEGQYLGVVMG